MIEILYRSDHLARLVDPEDVSLDPDDSNRLLDSGTATMKVYDPGVDMNLSADEAIGQTVLSVTDAGLFVIDDRVEIEADDGTFHNSLVTGVDPVASEITIADSLTVASASGQRVRRIFVTAPIAMALYGTPAVGSDQWGYQGPLDDDGLHQIIDQEIEVEMTLDAGPGVKIVKLLCLKVVESCEL